MTAETRTYNRLHAALRARQGITLIGGHPPSAKSYDTDLIRIPNPSDPSARWHVDLVFCSKETLYLCELKGALSESGDDITKLAEIIRAHPLPVLVPLM